MWMPTDAFPDAIVVTRWTAVQYERRAFVRRLFRLVVRLAPRLRAAHTRAVERLYAPGGGGYESAAAEFAELASCANEPAKRIKRSTD